MVTDFLYKERAIPALPKVPGQVFLHKGMEGHVPALLEALEQLFLHKGMEGPVPALSKVLGQVPPFPYGKRLVPALPKALGQLFLYKGMEGPVPALSKALGQVPPFPYEERPIPALLDPILALQKRWDRSPIVYFCNFFVLVIFRYFDQNTPKKIYQLFFYL